MPLKTPFKIGSLELPSNVFCAPLAGCSDLPFRQMTTGYKPGLVYCEMVKIDALIRHDPHTYRLLDYTRGMHPIGAQLCGSKPHIAKEAAKIVEDLGFDIIDFNCGCPVDKVTKDGSGSGMLKNLKLMGETLSAIVSAVKIPVTIKIRAGWDEKSLVGPQVVKIAEEAGAKAIAIHGRTREQAYKGSANWGWIKECKEAASNILVIGNGDLFNAEAVCKMFQETGCDAVLLARGTFGAPWIIEDVYRKLEGLEEKIRSPLDYKEALLTHFDAILNYHTPRKVMMDMRRVGCWYLKKGQGTKKLRESLNRSASLDEMRHLILDYPWHETQFIPSLSDDNSSEEESC
ncbi:tRNA dihydrouridine synthase DusB [Rhabdochlamydiaceae symbiont of Dictyostelium giganteum]|uniref:tRNA dihydrouridine synthase DusB n=1 Tax=Rhabdochlamydiaceae symbiont of Dictyostelium giganteum TaxID=3342349 RepID=UPI00384F9096